MFERDPRARRPDDAPAAPALSCTCDLCAGIFQGGRGAGRQGGWRLPLGCRSGSREFWDGAVYNASELAAKVGESSLLIRSSFMWKRSANMRTTNSK